MTEKKLLPPTYFLVSIAVMVALHYLFPLMKIIPTPLNLLGCIPLVVGVALNITADRAFKKNETTVKPFEESAALVTIGVYQISRHPMYLGMVLILTGLACLMGSLSPLVVIVIFAAAMELMFIRVEEKMLEKKFGRTWLNYKQIVRHWI